MSGSEPAPRPCWVGERTGAALVGDARLGELVSLGLRRNPRRAQLVVSTVLGKHVPADPELVHATGTELGEAVAKALDGAGALVLGFAETATALGHCVAEQLGATYLHSTRRRVEGATARGAFAEEHSHATAHQLLPADPELLAGPPDGAEVLVLVDDELSTGRTAMNTIAALHAEAPRRRYLLAVLVDLRNPEDRRRLEVFAAGLPAQVEVVSLAAGHLDGPPGWRDVAHAVVGRLTDATVPGAAPSPSLRSAQLIRHPSRWPAAVPEGGRHGFTATDARAARDAARRVADALAPQLPGTDVLVLGTEELMYAPLLIACALTRHGCSVRMGSTTRSPVLVVDSDAYPIRDVAVHRSHDSACDGPGQRYAYNVGHRTPDIVLVLDADSDPEQLHTRDGLCTVLAQRCERLHLVTLPVRGPGATRAVDQGPAQPRPAGAPPQPLRGPAFGSYEAEDVAWLLTDLSGRQLEAPTEEREEAIQSGGAHYAESLPVEYQPDAAYRELYTHALDAGAQRIAHAVGVVTEIVLDERGPDVVLASLARAGTPVGILMRRWAAWRHGLRPAHYALSIVRGRGIDVAALRYLQHQHDSAQVVFVDGWTGKGAITRELDAAIRAANVELGSAFDPALAVLADPGRCVRTFGTRADFLIPSACLNSTVSGLVSRTVLNTRVLAPGQFHGAKFYAELAGQDVSRNFLEQIANRFADVAAQVDRDRVAVQAGDRTPTWSGWAAVQRLSEQFGIGDVTLVKPGVGETTRVLLRRVPWAVLIAPGAGVELTHVRALAAERGVPVHEVADLPYSCVGLIHPRYTRAATGADGFGVPC